MSTGQVVADTFTYTVVDAHGASSAPTTLSINITGSNDAPTLTIFSYPVSTGNEDSPITVSFGGEGHITATDALSAIARSESYSARER